MLSRTAFPAMSTIKHRFPGLRTDDWIALTRRHLVLHADSLSAASFSQGIEVLQTQDALIKEIPELKTFSARSAVSNLHSIQHRV